MTFREYQNLAARTIPNTMTSRDMEYHSLHGLSAEIGELHGIYQKSYQNHIMDGVHVKKELGDILWFLAEFCTAFDWEFDEIAKLNIDKLRARYPEGFSAEKSLNRAKGDI